MFGLGITEILVLAVVVVLFWGPEKIPEIARTISKALVQLKRFTNDVKSNVKEGIENLGGKDLEAWKDFQRKVQGKMVDLHGQDLSVYLAKLAETLDEDKKALAQLKAAKQGAENDLQLIKKSLDLEESAAKTPTRKSAAQGTTKAVQAKLPAQKETSREKKRQAPPRKSQAAKTAKIQTEKAKQKETARSLSSPTKGSTRSTRASKPPSPIKPSARVKTNPPKLN